MRILATAACSASIFAGAAQAEDDILRMATISPSLSAAIAMATFANIVTEHVDGIAIEVSGGGAATLHMMEVARGNLDLAMTNPVVFGHMAAGRAMYRNEPEAPAPSENLQLLMPYPYGPYHFTVRADSDIQILDYLEGASVFLGPQGGGAYNAAAGWVESTTGLVAGEDYDAITANWQTGFQAFLDGTVDVYVNGCLDPCGQFIQFTETEEIRFLSPENAEGEGVEGFLGQYRFISGIEAGLYEGQLNDADTVTFGTTVGIGVRGDLDEETVYQITRAFWENLDQITSDAPWAGVLDVAAAPMNIGGMSLHPGATRCYREVGVLE